MTTSNRSQETSASEARRLWADATHLVAIEAQMQQLCMGGGSPELSAIAWEHIAAGGKRLRARLALFAVQVLGGRAIDGIAWGASCELLHNASLIHDDIQDGDRYRRGTQALWARHGIAQAINAGDLCITLGYSAIGEIPVSDGLRWQLARAVARSSRRIVEGQAAELYLLQSGVPGWSDYAACVEGKTSALFALPIEGAALLAGWPAAEAAQLADAFRPLGLLFQIQDDILDLYGNNGRDMPGSDLAQDGKASAFVVEHLRLHPGDQGWLMDILTTPRAQTSRESIAQVTERFAAGGALQAVWQRIDAIHHELTSSAALTREPALCELANRFVSEALQAVAHTRPEA